MSAPNFNYNNRCVVVTNDDFEMGNMPSLGNIHGDNSLRSYTSTTLSISDDFNYFDIVLTSGYYEHACIDYCDKDGEAKGVEYHCGNDGYFTSKIALFNEVKSSFSHISIYRMRKLCKGLNYAEDAEKIYAIIDEYLKDCEEKSVNKAIDGIKQKYGYEEYATAYRFSNGETGYRKVG